MLLTGFYNELISVFVRNLIPREFQCTCTYNIKIEQHLLTYGDKSGCVERCKGICMCKCKCIFEGKTEMSLDKWLTYGHINIYVRDDEFIPNQFEYKYKWEGANLSHLVVWFSFCCNWIKSWLTHDAFRLKHTIIR